MLVQMTAMVTADVVKATAFVSKDRLVSARAFLDLWPHYEYEKKKKKKKMKRQGCVILYFSAEQYRAFLMMMNGLEKNSLENLLHEPRRRIKTDHLEQKLHPTHLFLLADVIL